MRPIAEILKELEKAENAVSTHGEEAPRGVADTPDDPLEAAKHDAALETYYRTRNDEQHRLLDNRKRLRDELRAARGRAAKLRHGIPKAEQYAKARRVEVEALRRDVRQAESILESAESDLERAREELAFLEGQQVSGTNGNQ